MSIEEIRLKNYRAFKDSGIIKFGPIVPITGRNDVGKSAILHALNLFYNPPKKAGLDLSDIHAKENSSIADIEIAYNPVKLSSQEIQIDAKNKIHLTDDFLVDGSGMLRLRLSISSKEVIGLFALIKDIDDDALYPLALKNQEALLPLLEVSGLPAVKAGKETNQQKRKKLRDKAISDGKGNRERWVDVTSISKEIRNILPIFIFFTDSANYNIDETTVQNQFKSIVDKALVDNAGAKTIEDSIQSTIQGEFNKVYERLSHLTETITSIEAKAKVNWKKAVDSIDLQWGDITGISLPYELRGAGIRRLFMVAYFQYEAATSLYQGNGTKYIFCVEEPEVHLHPGAQRDLYDALKDLSDMGHQTIFTTHSPVFASIAPINDIVLIVRDGIAAVAKQVPGLDTNAIAKELGVEVSDRLVGKNHVILVEGPSDVEFYANVLTNLFTSGDTKLDPKDILFLQCGGIGNLRFSVATKCMDEAGLKWCVVADSDKLVSTDPLSRQAQLLDAACPQTCKHKYFLERSAIENYLDTTMIKSVTNIDCTVPQYGKLTDLSGNKLTKEKTKQIKSNAGVIAQRMGAQGILAHSKNTSGSSEFVQLFNNIKIAFNL